MKIFNSLTRKLETFIPLQEGKITIYTCGQTVNNVLHVGAARTYSQWDTIVKYLRWRGFDVIHVQNFTDVGHLTDDADQGDDKIIEKSSERNLKPMEFVDTMIREFLKDTDSLNIARPNVAPRATAHIPEMISLVKTLLEKGYAYETEKGVYFDVSRFSDYGRLAHIAEIDQLPGARIAVDPLKRNPKDFALWINADSSHLLQWDSPWGSGYPGWHLECSSMVHKYLGETIDIHGGGMEHMMLHHPNERAQSEAATGKPFVRYWLHAALVQLINPTTQEKEKMSKSGRFVPVRELIQRYGSNLIRFYLINSHYRTSIIFSEEQIEKNRDSFEKLMTTIISLRTFLKGTHFTVSELSSEGEQAKQDFIKAMDNDFNVSEAWKAIYTLSTRLNASTKTAPTSKIVADFQLFLELLDVMGVQPPAETPYIQLIENLIKLRNKLRTEKNFEIADEIRSVLSESGVFLKDTSIGSIYKIERW
ncbi:MAG: cysteine--tRNA ligase [Candidatus Hodarchaeota archaeon]